MPSAKKHTKIVLIIDNSIFIIERLVNMLAEADAGQRIMWATDYAEAAEKLNQEQVDIVLLDIQIPVKSGIDLLKYIAGNFPDTRVIVLSNLVSEFYRKLCIAEGAVCFVDKTTDFDKIPNLVTRF